MFYGFLLVKYFTVAFVPRICSNYLLFLNCKRLTFKLCYDVTVTCPTKIYTSCRHFRKTYICQKKNLLLMYVQCFSVKCCSFFLLQHIHRAVTRSHATVTPRCFLKTFLLPYVILVSSPASALSVYLLLLPLCSRSDSV